MRRLTVSLCLLLFFVCVQIAAAADTIGFAFGDGAYRVNGARVRGNATLFAGATVETGDAPARLQIRNGARVWLTARSQASVFADGIRLVKGLGQYEGPSGSGLQARAIRVVASVPETVVRVMLDEKNGAVVVPIRGEVDVMNARGVRVGDLRPGSAVRFAESTAAAAEVHVSGCVYRQGKGFTLMDGITHVPVRLTGSVLEGESGHVVAVSGVQQDADGSVSVSSIERVESGACEIETPVRGSPVLLATAATRQITERNPQVMPARLNLLVIEGSGAINNIRQRTAREPIVEVQDENHRPVAGAAILFALPKSGPGGVFPNGATTLRVTTDQQGRAIARGLRPNRQSGQFQIAVTASYGELTAATTILQTNLLAGAAAAGAAGAAGAGAAGADAAGAGAGTATTGLAIGAKVAIISGIAASATVGGLAASGAIFGGGSTPDASR
jgi:hypothetical protein